MPTLQNSTDIQKLIPTRAPDAHKGSCGRVGIIAGSCSMIGAAILCARSALRSGAGLVYLFTVSEAIPYINIQYPELIVLHLKTENGFIHSEALTNLADYISKYQISGLAIGPGIGVTGQTKILVEELIKKQNTLNIPIVVDADALNVLSQNFLENLPQKNLLILTPHPKEFSRLFSNISATESRTKQAILASQKSKQIVILKGNKSIIANNNFVYNNETGNNALATAGTGDVLTGLIAGLLVQGLPPLNAARLGTYLHGLAGEISAEEKGIYSVIATDVLEAIPQAFKKVQGLK